MHHFVFQIWYITKRKIKKGEELLVYYGRSYARDLGIEGMYKLRQPRNPTLFLEILNILDDSIAN